LNTNSVIADSVSVNPATFCIGSATIITKNGGSLGTGSQWYWYTGSCGGTYMGTGVTISDLPSQAPPIM